jgi:hypothetical protein
MQDAGSDEEVKAAIPQRWREALRGMDVVQPLLDAPLVQAGADQA